MGEPPYPRQRTLDRSASPIPGRLRKNSYTVGTKKACVTPCSRICSRIAAGATSRTTMVRPPQHDHMPQAGQLRPDLVDDGRELRAHDRDHGAAVVQHVTQLLRGEPPVDHGADEPALGGR